jgi:hypothetical protein
MGFIGSNGIYSPGELLNSLPPLVSACIHPLSCGGSSFIDPASSGPVLEEKASVGSRHGEAKRV